MRRFRTITGAALLAVAMAALVSALTGCRSVCSSAPAPTGGYAVDYGKCNVGADVYACKDYGVHNALDFAADLFAPIIAAAPGTVQKIVRDGTPESRGFHGAYVEVSHGHFFTRYSHMENIPAALSVGDAVRRGQKIGENGLTGYTCWPHLHFATLCSQGTVLNPHALWHVPEGQLAAKTITVPFFDRQKTYAQDDRLTFPMSYEDCQKQWQGDVHPTKPWLRRRN